jgi:hypothetical protein
MSNFSYQWERNGVDIPGANKYTYVATTDDVGCKLSRRSDYLDSATKGEELVIEWEKINHE